MQQTELAARGCRILEERVVARYCIWRSLKEVAKELGASSGTHLPSPANQG